MQMDNFAQLLQFFVDNYLELAITVVFAIGMAWLRTYKESKEDEQFENFFEKFVDRAVLAAEEAISEGGENKEEWVVNVVSDEFPDLDQEYIRVAVKAAVRLMKGRGLEKGSRPLPLTSDPFGITWPPPSIEKRF